MKKFLALLAALCLVVTLSACGGSVTPSNEPAVPTDPADEGGAYHTTASADPADSNPAPTGDNPADSSPAPTGDDPDVERVNLGCCVTDIAVREAPLLGENSVELRTHDFIITLNTDRQTYRVGDTINIWGTLEYIGENDSVTIYHSCPFMQFSITGESGGRDFGEVLGGVIVDVLATSTLQRGRVYHFDYRKSGGWDADGPDNEFWEDFFSRDELSLPAGEYTITLEGGFSLSEAGSPSGLHIELPLVVTE